MPISMEDAPTEGPTRLSKLLASLPSAAPEGVARDTVPEICVSRPIPIYSGAPETFAKSGADGLRAASRTGWRYLVLGGGDTLVVDLLQGNGGSRAFRGGQVAAKLAHASKIAEAIVDPSRQYEARILDLYPMDQPLLWLRERGGTGADRFVSLGRVTRPVCGRNLLRALRKKAGVQLSRAERWSAAAGE